MLSKLSLAIAPVILLGLAPAALAQRDLSSGSGDHMRSYGPVEQNAAPRTAPPQRETRARRAERPRYEAPRESREVSGRGYRSYQEEPRSYYRERPYGYYREEPRGYDRGSYQEETNGY